MRLLNVLLCCAVASVLLSSCWRSHVCSCETVTTDTSTGAIKSNSQFGMPIESINRENAKRACQEMNRTTIFSSETTVTTCILY